MVKEARRREGRMNEHWANVFLVFASMAVGLNKETNSRFREKDRINIQARVTLLLFLKLFHLSPSSSRLWLFSFFPRTNIPNPVTYCKSTSIMCTFVRFLSSRSWILSLFTRERKVNNEKLPKNHDHLSLPLFVPSFPSLDGTCREKEQTKFCSVHSPSKTLPCTRKIHTKTAIKMNVCIFITWKSVSNWPEIFMTPNEGGKSCDECYTSWPRGRSCVWNDWKGI